jgi:hypothetical protein
MPWYKTGTVSVTLNSNAVTGAGTAFIANCRVGDAFRGPDGRWYEVTNAPSNTSLSISPAYLGPTASGGSYALAPMQGYVKDSADALRSIVNTYGAQLAALKTTGNYDVLPVSKGGTAGTTPAEARTALGALGPGDYGVGGTIGIMLPNSNANTLSVNGRFCTPPTWVGSVFSGTAGRNQGYITSDINVINNYKYQRWTALASSDGVMERWQEAGVWTEWKVPGIERGSNSNGEYVKYADGTMECWRRDTTTTNIAITTASGGLFFAFATISFPSTFVGIPAVDHCSASAGALTLPLYGANVSATGCALFFGAANSATVPQYISYTAKGRWR